MSANSEALPAFTPGPWRPTKGGSCRRLRNDPEMMDFSCAVYADAPYTENEAGDFREETEQVVVSARGRTLAEAEANACLSAAAPEMVEALKATIFGLEILAKELGRSDDRVWAHASGLDAARAALAKATGGE